MDLAVVLLIGIAAALGAHTLLRELGTPEHLLPLHFVWRLGHGFEVAYYWIGKALGHAWYWSCRVCNFVARHLWDAIVRTAEDLWRAIKPYFRFSEIWKGMKEVGWAFWIEHRVAIRRGTIAIVSTAAIAALAWTGWTDAGRAFWTDHRRASLAAGIATAVIAAIAIVATCIQEMVRAMDPEGSGFHSKAV